MQWREKTPGNKYKFSFSLHNFKSPLNFYLTSFIISQKDSVQENWDGMNKVSGSSELFQLPKRQDEERDRKVIMAEQQDIPYFTGQCFDCITK